MICCHTPLKKQVPAYGDKFVLVSGIKDVLSVCREYGFRKAIHVDELYSLIPEICPVATKEYPKDIQAAKKDALLRRLGGNMSEAEFI